MAARVHPFPYRTRKLSSLVSKILGWKRPGKIERCQHLVGVDGDEGTPVPIPNTEVKLISVEDTWLETARENRKMPTSRARPIGRAFFGSANKCWGAERAPPFFLIILQVADVFYSKTRRFGRAEPGLPHASPARRGFFRQSPVLPQKARRFAENRCASAHPSPAVRCAAAHITAEFPDTFHRKTVFFICRFVHITARK